MSIPVIIIIAAAVFSIVLMFSLKSGGSSGSGQNGGDNGDNGQKNGLPGFFGRMIDKDPAGNGAGSGGNTDPENDPTRVEINFGSDSEADDDGGAGVPDFGDGKDCLTVTLSQIQFGTVTNQKNFRMKQNGTIVEIGRGSEKKLESAAYHYRLVNASNEISHSQCVLTYSVDGVCLFHCNKANLNTYVGNDKVGQNGVIIRPGTDIRMGNDNDSIFMRVDYTMPESGGGGSFDFGASPMNTRVHLM